MSFLGIHVLDLILGLIFVYFIFSIISSTIVELIAQIASKRSKELEIWLTSLFRDGELGRKVLANFHIDGLTKAGSKASYISGNAFAKALFSEIAKGAAGSDATKADSIAQDVQALRAEILKSPLLSQDQKLLFASHIDIANNDINHAHDNVARWFDSAMDRVSGTYRKYAQKITLIVSIGLAFSLNIDTVALIQYFRIPNEETEKLIEKVVAFSSDDANLPPPPSPRPPKIPRLPKFPRQPRPTDTAGTVIDFPPFDQGTPTVFPVQISPTIWPWIYDLDWNKSHYLDQPSSILNEAAGLPLGWSGVHAPARHPFIWAITKFLGLLISAFAISVNAGFWFNLLNKISNLRSAGKVPDTVDEANKKKA